MILMNRSKSEFFISSMASSMVNPLFSGVGSLETGEFFPRVFAYVRCVGCCSTVVWTGCGWVMAGMIEVSFDLFRGTLAELAEGCSVWGV